MRTTRQPLILVSQDLAGRRWQWPSIGAGRLRVRDDIDLRSSALIALAGVNRIRDGLARDSYADPGPYKNPPGTVAYEIDAPVSEPPRQVAPKDKSKPADMKGMNMKGMKGM
jgi:hypothetical protein